MMRKTTTVLFLTGFLALFPLGAGLWNGVPDAVPAAATSSSEDTALAWLSATVRANAALDAAGLARAITDAQAGLLGSALPEAPAPAPGSTASVLRILELRGLGPSAASVAAIATLEAAPEPLRASLARLLADFAWYTEVTQSAVAGVDTDGLDLHDPPADLVFPLAPIMAAQNALLRDAADLRSVLADPAARLARDVVVPDAFALRLSGACNDDTYVDDLPFIADECGNDVFRNNAGGGHGIVCPSSLVDTNVMPAGALLDFGGDDSYESGRSCGINGGGALGAGFLYDAAGNDRYVAGNDDFGTMRGNDGVNGGGVIGSAVLVDAEGNDVYEAGGWGTNGGGYPFSRALLLDDGVGDDSFTATFDAVNGGGAAGIGTLCDMGGTDWYWEYFEDATGYDVTRIPKGGAGAQLDWA